MTSPEAQNIAEAFTRQLNHRKTDAVFAVSNPRHFQQCFCFELTVKSVDNAGKEMDTRGAGGIIIDKTTRQASAITSGEVNLLESNKKELERIYAFIAKRDDPNNFIFLEKIFQLSPGELLRFQQEIFSSKQDKEKILTVIQHLLDVQSKRNF